MLKAICGAFFILVLSGAALAAENTKSDAPSPQNPTEAAGEAKPNDDMKQIQSRIAQTWHQPKVTRRLAVSLRFTIDKNGGLKSIAITKTSGDKAVDAAAVSAIKRAQPFPALTGKYAEMTISYTFECRPDTEVNNYRLNGVPIKDQGYRITSGGATLRPLDTNSKAEEYLAKRAQQLGDRVVALKDKLAQQENSAGPDSPSVATTLSELANAQKQLGQYDESDANFKRLITLEEKLDDKPGLARSLADYGDGFYRRSKYTEAEPILARAIALKKQLGLSRPADAATLEEYAKLLYKLNRASEAESIYQEIRTLR